MKIIIRVIILLFLPLALASNAEDVKTDWIFCTVTDDYHSTVYFTEIFHGNYDQLERYEQEFLQHIVEKYGDDIDEDTSCSFEGEKAATDSEYLVQVADSKEFYKNVVATNWKR